MNNFESFEDWFLDGIKTLLIAFFFVLFLISIMEYFGFSDSVHDFEDKTFPFLYLLIENIKLFFGLGNNF